jgi:two-component system, chemotaxis family, sensor kinase CheA
MPDEMEEIVAEFITESEETLDKVDPLFVELEAKGDDKEILNKLFRSVHTIKGAAGFLGFQSMVDVAHTAENIMKKLRDGDIKVSRQLMDTILKAVDMLRLLLKHVKDKDGIKEDTAPLVQELSRALETALQSSGGAQPAASGAPAGAGIASGTAPSPAARAPEPATSSASVATIDPAAEKTAPEKQESLQTLRVDVSKIDKVMDLTGEVVLVRNRLLNIVSRLEHQYSDDHNVQSLLEAVSFLDLITSDMQLGVIKMRMQPIQKVFGKFPRLVRDISGPLGKAVELRVSGEDTEVDKSVIEQIGDPMVHIIRNAVDHGLEPPQERLAKGKPATGVIAISAEQKGSQIIIEVSDDGRGIDVDRVKKKAIEKNLISEEDAARMTDDAAINLVFLPGFSTAEVATELSGRGVGMDVVKTNISKLNGNVEITSKKGKGSTFTIRIPLTLAIIQTLMVQSGNARYAVPLAPVEETLTVSKDAISHMGSMEALIIRDKVYPLFKLSSMLGTVASTDNGFQYAVVLAIGDKRFCIGVDKLLGQEEVVIKTVSGINAGSSHILGATITGDGKVVFILDLASLAKGVMSA